MPTRPTHTGRPCATCSGHGLEQPIQTLVKRVTGDAEGADGSSGAGSSGTAREGANELLTVSCALEAVAKFYAYRVDRTHADSFKVLGVLLTGEDESESDDEKGDMNLPTLR